MNAADAINEFLCVYLADKGRGAVRPDAEYLALFPGFEAEVEGELRALRGGGRAPASNGHVGPYEILSLLGRGTQGRVWLAEDSRLGRKVALKLLSGVSGLSPVGRVRFQREAEIVSRLDHPGICTVYEAGEHEGVPFIAMRYLAGETLAKQIAGMKAPPESRAELARILGWIEEAARAVHVAHSAGIVHRDIKPGNIMITADGRAVLLDFGIAQEVEGRTLTLSGDLFGTPAYMAPEQISGSTRLLDHQVDVHALGVTLYECLTLVLPYRGTTRETLFREVLSRPVPDPRRINPALPRDARAVLEKALEKEPRRRYATALELAEELARLRRGEPVRARAITAPERAWRWARREPVRAGLLSAGMLAVLLAGILGLNWSRIQAASAEEERVRRESWNDQGFAELEHGELAKARVLFEHVLSESPSDPEAIAGTALCLVHSDAPRDAIRFLEERRDALELYPDLEWLLVHAYGTFGVDARRARELYLQIEVRKSPLGLFVSGLANEQGLSFEVTNVTRSTEFLARALVTSRQARSLLRATEDYGRRRAEAEVVSADLSRHLLYRLRPAEPGERVGHMFSCYGAAGDIDRDGFGEFLVPFAVGHPDERDIPIGRIYSGKDGKVLRTYSLQPIPPPDAAFDERTLLEDPQEPALRFCLVPDLNGDGIPEHFIGSAEWDPESKVVPNAMAVFDGALGRELWRRGPESCPQFISLSLFGDVDRDGVPELQVSLDSGVLLLAARTGEEVATVPLTFGRFAPAGDVDGDGSIDLIHGDCGEDRHGFDSGGARVCSLWDGTTGLERAVPLFLLAVTGKAPQDKLGLNVGSLGDVDGDGHSDFYASEHWASDRGFQTGRVRAFSGGTGRELYEILGDVPLGKFGFYVTVVGDFDGDGLRDLGVPSMRSSRNGHYSGSISVFSARTGARLLTIDGPGPGAGLGHGLADAGDVNGDGTPDLICAAYWPGDNQDLAELQGADLLGTVYVLSGKPVR